MNMFREVNGGPGEASPTTASGAPIAAPVPKTVGTPSAEGRAEAMELFEEVNGGPGQPAPTTSSGAPIAKTEAAAPLPAPVPKTVGTPSPEGRAEAMELFEEVNGGPGQAAPPKTVGTPSPEGRAEAMELFEEVNGGPGQAAPPKTVGTPSPEGRA